MSIARLQEIERQIASLHAAQAEALVAVASSERVVDEYLISTVDRDDERAIRIEDACREEVAAALRWAPSTTQARIDDARLLVGPMHEVLIALDRGEISPQHARVLTEAAQRLPGRWAPDGADAELFTAACADLVCRVLPIARRATVSVTRLAARRAVLAIDAEGERRRREQARCTRDVWVVDELDGVSTVMARMSTEHAHAVMNRLDAVAKATKLAAQSDSDAVPHRHDGAGSWTVGEHRAHALAAAVFGGDCISTPSMTAHLDLVIDLPTFLALRAEDATGSVDLVGSGAATAQVVHDLLADPDVAVTLQRMVSDPLTGHLLDYGRRTYQIPDRLREFVVARDRTCRFPGCRRSASRCQIDHAVAWEDGGATAPDNVGALCARHHQLKTHGGWQITRCGADGTCSWLSPEGRIYEHEPPPIGVPPPDDVGPVHGPTPF
jgi:hypothetical protein